MNDFLTYIKKLVNLQGDINRQVDMRLKKVEVMIDYSKECFELRYKNRLLEKEVEGLMKCNRIQAELITELERQRRKEVREAILAHSPALGAPSPTGGVPKPSPAPEGLDWPKPEVSCGPGRSVSSLLKNETGDGDDD